MRIFFILNTNGTTMKQTIIYKLKIKPYRLFAFFVFFFVLFCGFFVVFCFVFRIFVRKKISFKYVWRIYQLNCFLVFSQITKDNWSKFRNRRACAVETWPWYKTAEANATMWTYYMCARVCVGGWKWEEGGRRRWGGGEVGGCKIHRLVIGSV